MKLTDLLSGDFSTKEIKSYPRLFLIKELLKKKLSDLTFAEQIHVLKIIHRDDIEHRFLFPALCISIVESLGINKDNTEDLNLLERALVMLRERKEKKKASITKTGITKKSDKLISKFNKEIHNYFKGASILKNLSMSQERELVLEPGNIGEF